MTSLSVQPEEKPYCAHTGCVELAQWHVKFYDDSETMECQEHFRSYLNPDFTKIDFHEIGHACGVHGSEWHHSIAIVGDGYCAIDWGGNLNELISKELATA